MPLGFSLVCFVLQNLPCGIIHLQNKWLRGQSGLSSPLHRGPLSPTLQWEVHVIMENPLALPSWLAELPLKGPTPWLPYPGLEITDSAFYSTVGQSLPTTHWLFTKPQIHFRCCHIPHSCFSGYFYAAKASNLGSFMTAQRNTLYQVPSRWLSMIPCITCYRQTMQCNFLSFSENGDFFCGVSPGKPGFLLLHL